MRTRCMFAFVALLTCSFFTKVMAATPEEVAEAMRLMGGAKWHPRVSASKTYDDGALQMVFVARDQRYTCYLPFGEGYPLKPRPGFLSVWVRRNGTSGQAKLLTFSDEDLDGKVDFGIGGSKSDSDEARRYFDSGKLAHARGEVYRAYWQAMYDRAISETLRRLRHRGDRYFRAEKWHRELHHGQAAAGARL